MADNLTPITSDQLSKVTTAQDTDLVTLGINGNFVSMTLANLKEVLGINALNTNTTPRKYPLTLLNGFEGSAWCVVIGRFVLLHVSVTCPGNTGILAKLPDELVPATMQFDDLWLQSPGNPSDIGDDTIDLMGSITVWDASGSSAPGHVGLRTWGGGAIKQGYIARTSFVYYLG